MSSSEFYKALATDRSNKLIDIGTMSRVRYEAIVSRVLESQLLKKEDPFLKRYDVVVENGEKKLIGALKNKDDKPKYFVHDDELFTILDNIHLSLNHGGRDKMIAALRKSYRNVHRRAIQIYLETCHLCPKLHKKKNPEVHISRSRFCSVRGHVHVLGLADKKDGAYCFLMIYIDLEYDFVVLKPLKKYCAKEIADNLVDVFTTIGAPFILESHDSRAFTQEIISHLNDLWPELKILNGMSSNVSFEIEKVKLMLETWMKENDSPHWVHGLRFVQLLKNNALPVGSGKSPFEYLFRTKCKMGLTTEYIPYVKLRNLKTEEELKSMLEEDSTAEKIITVKVNDKASNGDVERVDDEEMEDLEHDENVPTVHSVISLEKDPLADDEIEEVDFED